MVIDVMEWAWEFIKKAVDGFIDALKTLVLDIGSSFTLDAILSGPLFFLVIGNRWLVAFDNFLSSLPQIVPRAALEIALKRFPAPRWTRSRSLSAENAYELVVMSIVLPSLAIVNGTLPLHVRMINRIQNRSKIIRFLLNPTVEKWLAIILKPFKLTVLKIISVFWQVAAVTINFGAAIFGLLLVSAFVESGEQDLLDICFQQSTPRKRRHLDTGKLILRREPGGSKP